MKSLLILGAGGHGKVVADIAIKLNRYDEIAFLDDNKKEDIYGLKIKGTLKEIQKYINTSDFFVAIGDNKIRVNFNCDDEASYPITSMTFRELEI